MHQLQTIDRLLTLPKGWDARELIEDALDHLIDGPRTSPSLVRRLLIRTYGETVPPRVVGQAIERFEDLYDRAFALLPDADVSPAELDGGVRGRLITYEAALRTEWAAIRDGIIADGSASVDHNASNPPSHPSRVAIPFPEDGFDGAADAEDDEYLMLEPLWVIERRARRKVKFRAIGSRAAGALLRAGAIGGVLAIVLAFLGIV